MVLRVFPYFADKEKKKQERAVDAMSVLETMDELESYNGVTLEKLQDNWYEMKRQFRDAVVAEVEEVKKGSEPEKVNK